MKEYQSLDPKELAVPTMHRYLLTAVAPRPICFASTIDYKGNVNLSPFSFFNVFSANPPIMVFSPSRRGRDNTTKDTYDNVLDVPEVCINIVNYQMVQQMSLTSTEYDKDINEFEKAGLTMLPSQKIRPPRVGESPVSFECKVNQVVSLGEGPGSGQLVIAEVLLFHIDRELLDEKENLDTTRLDLIARMGSNWYCRASGEALFEVPKPTREKGIGVDQLPEFIRTSDILSGNDLGRLGNLSEVPNATFSDLIEHPEVKKILSGTHNATQRSHAIHQLAKQWIENGQIEKAYNLLVMDVNV